MDVGAIGFIWQRFGIGALDHGLLIHQDLSALRVGCLFHDCCQRVELADHHCRHPSAGLADLFERSLHQPLVADLIGDDTDDSAVVAVHLGGCPDRRDLAQAVAEPVDARQCGEGVVDSRG